MTREGKRRERKGGVEDEIGNSVQTFPISVVDLDPLSFGKMNPDPIFVPSRLWLWLPKPARVM